MVGADGPMEQGNYHASSRPRKTKNFTEFDVIVAKIAPLLTKMRRENAPLIARGVKTQRLQQSARFQF
jgi:hypothetical protein